MSYETIPVENRGRVGLITLIGPAALNAPHQRLTAALLDPADKRDDDPGVGCPGIAGSEKAFAACADDLLEEALKAPETVAGLSLPLATADQKEGMRPWSKSANPSSLIAEDGPLVPSSARSLS